eukprot:Nk52_evm70s1992 gene=Nk52_evmTU70s1992
MSAPQKSTVLKKQRSSLLNYSPGFFKGVEFEEKLNGGGLRVAIVYAKWNADVVNPLVEGCLRGFKACGVKEEDVILQAVPGSFELPYGASQIIKSQRLDAVVTIGVLIKGETMHFEYISEAVSHGIMKLGIDSGVPVIFGVLTCLNENQAKDRAGLNGGHSHAEDWARTAVEMAQLRKHTGSY